MTTSGMHRRPFEGQNLSGLEKTQGLKKKKQLGFFGFIGFFRFHYLFLYYCVFKLFLTRKKKITVQQMFHLEVLLRHLSECCGCHYACAEQDV